jgi:YVTN family beta-propeller protein
LWVLLAGLPAQANEDVQVGKYPYAIAVNPVTNKIYVANSDDGNVTVFGGVAFTPATIADPNAGGPIALAVNPVTNKIYVANYGSGNVTVINGFMDTFTTVSVGSNPRAVAVDPLTNKIYVANYGSGTVTVIDGATNNVTTVTVGTNPYALAVNPATNKVYVANYGSTNVTVIDGATNNTTTVAAGTNPYAVAVNPVTNKVYVANNGSANVTVIDGASNSTATVSAQTNPDAVAVNPLTNKVYVANHGSNSVTVIDGASGNVLANATVPSSLGNNAGAGPVAIAVDPVTNKIYVACDSQNSAFEVIDGATNQATAPLLFPYQTTTYAAAVNPVTYQVYFTYSQQAGYYYARVLDREGYPTTTTTVKDASAVGPFAAAANPVTNKVYVANHDSGNVTVIDGATKNTATVAAGTHPQSVAVNPITNKIYVANNGSNNVTVIDGATNNASTVADPKAIGPYALAVNPVTNKIYVANNGSANVTVINGATATVSATVTAGTNPVAVAIDPGINKIFVANNTSFGSNGAATIIDGSNNQTTNVTVTDESAGVAVNPVTHKVYVISSDYERTAGVNVINPLAVPISVTSVSGIWGASVVAVDPVKNLVYVGSSGATDQVYLVDGANDTLKSTGGGFYYYQDAAVNPANDTVYLLYSGNGNGVQGFGPGVPPGYISLPGTSSKAIAVNPVTGTVYVANNGSNDVTVISPQIPPVPINTTIAPLAGNTTALSKPTFSFTAANTFSSAPVDNVAFQVDTWQWPWLNATSQGGGAFSGAASTLQQGFHILYAYATDGEEATSTTTGTQSNPLTGSIAAYGFLVGPPPVANVSPTSLSFGNQAIGSASAAQTVTLSNTGAGALHFSVAFSGTNESDFTEVSSDTCSGLSGQLAASSSCTIGVTFTPSAAGAESATLTVTDDSNGIANSTQTVSLTGSGAGPLVSLPTLALTFGSQLINTTSAAQAETVTNTGNANLIISTATIGGTNATDFAKSTDTCTGATLLPNGICTVGVTFTPVAAGARSASLTFTDNAASSPQEVMLTGTGTLPSSIAISSVSPASVTLAQGGSSQAVTVNITAMSYTGTVTLATSTLPTGVTATITQPGTGKSGSITLQASSTAPLVSNQTITITASGTGVSSVTGTFSLTVLQAVPIAGTSPSNLTFAGQSVNTTSASQAVTLSNTGTAALTISNITTTSNFSQTNNCASSVAAGASCAINVTFTPTAAGSLTGTLTIADNSNGTMGSTQTVSLSGTGQDFSFAPPSGSSTSATVAPGSPATYTLSVGGEGGLSGTVSFTCTGAPSEATCTVSPNPATVGGSTTNVNVTVTTTAASAGVARSRPLPPLTPLSPGLGALSILALILAAIAWGVKRRNQPGVSGWQSAMVLFAAGLLLTLAIAGCGGGGGGGGGTPPPSNPGTPAGTYTLTVTGTTGSGTSTLSHSVTLTLTVS